MAQWSDSIAFGLTMVLVAVSLVSSEELLSIRGELIHRTHSSSPYMRDQPRSSNSKHVLTASRRNLLGEIQPLPAPMETNNTFIAEVTVGPYEYLMSISLGTPPQEFVAVMDTGSYFTWLQCECETKSCINQSAPIFEPSRSSSYSPLACQSSACRSLHNTNDMSPGSCQTDPYACPYMFSYGTRSNTSGTLASESLHIRTTPGGLTEILPYFWFGCSSYSYSNQGFYTSGNGVVGLGQGILSFPSQLGGRYGDVFSYCFVSQSLDSSQASLVMFGREARLSGDGVQYTPLLQSKLKPWLYIANLETIYVEGKPVNFSVDALVMHSDGIGGTIFDSSSTYSELISVAYDPLLEALKTKIDKLPRLDYLNRQTSWLELCYDVTNFSRWEYEPALPMISLQFANTSGAYELGFEQSWIEVPDLAGPDTHAICLAILRSTYLLEFQGFSIIGNIQQRNFHVSFDRANNRIGFVPTNCSSV